MLTKYNAVLDYVPITISLKIYVLNKLSSAARLSISINALVSARIAFILTKVIVQPRVANFNILKMSQQILLHRTLLVAAVVARTLSVWVVFPAAQSHAPPVIAIPY